MPCLRAPGAGIARVLLRPDVPVPVGRRGVVQGCLEPGVVAGGVVQHQVKDDPDAPPMGLLDETLEVLIRAVLRIDALVVLHVIAVVTRGLEDRHQPDARRPQVGGGRRVSIVDVIKLLDEPVEVADAVTIAVGERSYEDLVADRVVGPGGAGCGRGCHRGRVVMCRGCRHGCRPTDRRQWCQQEQHQRQDGGSVRAAGGHHSSPSILVRCHSSWPRSLARCPRAEPSTSYLRPASLSSAVRIPTP